VTWTALLLAAVSVVLWGAAPASAETFQFEGADGTVHFTNAPSDPRYRRMAGVLKNSSGTAEGFLRIPAAAASATLTDTIREAAQRHGVPEQLVSAVIRVESGFNTRAVSRKGARGLMQLMPGTAAILGVRDSFDPTENIDGGVRHLRGLLDRYGNNLPFALAAYNAGEGAVNNYGGIPPYPETQAYVGRILSILGLSGDGLGTLMPSGSAYTYVADDGAVVYTNIPPRVTRSRR
jgi:soluble lytic murein transglycosylase-like protein